MNSSSSPMSPPGGAAESTDASLLRRYQSGDDDAATALYRRYAGRLLGLATARTSSELQTRLDPEDIVQSVFRTFFRRAALGEYEVPAGEELWKLFLVIGLYKVRAAAVHHRAAKRDVRQMEPAAVLEQWAGTPDDVALNALRMTIDEVLAPLPPDYREVVRLRVDGFGVAEIAAQTGRSKRSVERILQEFRHKLQAVINEAH
jgi:RNA polymerase sigma-70 factor (ECF subfamily)